MAAIVMQSAAIIAVTITALLIISGSFSKLILPVNSSPMLGHSFLTWAYLVTAIGFAFTKGRFVETTAERIRQAARAMHPAAPALVIKILLSQCLLCAIGSAVISLSIPPDFLIALARKMGYANFATLIWPAVFSLGISGFGATAHAAQIALL